MDERGDNSDSGSASEEGEPISLRPGPALINVSQFGEVTIALSQSLYHIHLRSAWLAADAARDSFRPSNRELPCLDQMAWACASACSCMSAIEALANSILMVSGSIEGVPDSTAQILRGTWASIAEMRPDALTKLGLIAGLFGKEVPVLDTGRNPMQTIVDIKAIRNAIVHHKEPVAILGQKVPTGFAGFRSRLGFTRNTAHENVLGWPLARLAVNATRSLMQSFLNELSLRSALLDRTCAELPAFDREAPPPSEEEQN